MSVMTVASLFSSEVSAQRPRHFDPPQHLEQVKQNPAAYAAVDEFMMDLKQGISILTDDSIFYLWQVVAPGAKGLQAYFSELELGEEATLEVWGLFTNVQYIRSSDNANGGGHATKFFRGDRLNLMLKMPIGSEDAVVAKVDEVAYAFRDPYPPNARRDFKHSDSCQINVNCTEGAGWEDELRSVVRISAKAGPSVFWCSGTLVNNTMQDCAPYILSADHCADGADADDLDQWVFYFQYQSDDCTTPGSEGVLDQKNMTGCTALAASTSQGDSDSDFLLVKLTSEVPQFYSPHFAGWDRRDLASNTGVSIHHPSGDIKKISTFSAQPASDSWGTEPGTHWRVNWVATANGHGVTEEGSSGGPLFNSNKQVIGTLTGGASACENLGGNGPNEPDYFGKISWSWDQFGADSSQQLKVWLDPTESLVDEIEGIDWPCLEEPIVSISERDLQPWKVFPNPSTGEVQIQIQGELSSIQLLNIQGQLVQEFGGREELQLHLKPGIYVLKSGIYSEKLIVK
jgi:hypothetical protein